MDLDVLLLASLTVIAHAGIAYVLVRRVKREGAALRIEIEKKANAVGAAVVASIDWAKLPIEDLLRRTLEDPAGQKLIASAVDHITGALLDVVKKFLTQSLGGQKGSARQTETRALGDLVLKLADNWGLSPIIDGLGMTETVKRNPVGTINALRTFLGPKFDEMVVGMITKVLGARQPANNPEANVNIPEMP